MRNQHLDTKTSSTLSRTSQVKIPLLLGLSLIVLFTPQVFADVFVPHDEYVGYFDANGIYTVVGNVKNENDFSIIPTITVSVMDGSQIISKTINHVPLGINKEIPFKIKFPELSSSTPILINPDISFEKTITHEIPIQVLYDKTLIQHDDGHITGRIQNVGEHTIFYPKIFAVVHGYENVLDVVQNIEFIEKIDPGEILDFSMYPDPSITKDIFYYSCFGPVDTTVVPVTTKKDGGDFDFRYDSGAWYSAAKFDEKGTTMSLRGYNSYPLETYANFEFPPISGNEKFSVTLDGKPVEFIQSVDEMGFWHVAFKVEPSSQGTWTISGFEKGLPVDLPRVPKWVKLNADWWSTDQISDTEFLEGIDYLFEKQIISVPSREVISESQWRIPQWVKNPVGWWYEEKISDDDLLNIIENLVKREIIIV